MESAGQSYSSFNFPARDTAVGTLAQEKRTSHIKNTTLHATPLWAPSSRNGIGWTVALKFKIRCTRHRCGHPRAGMDSRTEASTSLHATPLWAPSCRKIALLILTLHATPLWAPSCRDGIGWTGALKFQLPCTRHRCGHPRAGKSHFSY
jgi:hypothetical protein